MKAFVVMPFLPEFDDIYLLGIRAACEKVGIDCERVDEQIFQETILDRIINEISSADLIIAETTGRNPNVFYEIGYAHALGKRVMLLTKSGSDIPFDLKSYPHLIYKGSISRLKAELVKRIPKYLQEEPPSPRGERLLTADRPDVRVEVMNGLLGHDLQTATPFLEITAQNYSPLDVFLGNFFLIPKSGGIMIPHYNDATMRPQGRVVLKPGEAHTFHIGGEALFQETKPEEIVDAGVRDEVGRRYMANRGKLEEAMKVVYRHVVHRRSSGGKNWD